MCIRDRGIVRDVVKSIGYDCSEVCFDGNTCAVLVSIEEQSPDIAMGVNEALEVKEGEEASDDAMTGAGDQGMMFGFACDETDELMPMPISLAHRLAERLADIRKDGTLRYLRPDGKTQVTVEYDDDRVVRVDTVVISTPVSYTHLDVYKRQGLGRILYHRTVIGGADLKFYISIGFVTGVRGIISIFILIAVFALVHIIYLSVVHRFNADEGRPMLVYALPAVTLYMLALWDFVPFVLL